MSSVFFASKEEAEELIIKEHQGVFSVGSVRFDTRHSFTWCGVYAERTVRE